MDIRLRKIHVKRESINEHPESLLMHIEGLELRNEWYKGSIGPEAVTNMQNGSRELAVFVGFFGLISNKTISQSQAGSKFNFLLLNSTSFFGKSLEFMERHERIRLFFDRNKTGQNCIQQALSWSAKYEDESGLYNGYMI